MEPLRSVSVAWSCGQALQVSVARLAREVAKAYWSAAAKYKRFAWRAGSGRGLKLFRKMTGMSQLWAGTDRPSGSWVTGGRCLA